MYILACRGSRTEVMFFAEIVLGVIRFSVMLIQPLSNKIMMFSL